jgi:hypothetical protein
MNVELQNGIKHIKTGIGSWSSRLRNILEQIEEKHILYIQEDFFLLNCYGPLINEIYKLHNQHSLDITKLASNYEFTLNRIDSPFDGVNAYQQMPGLYIMSHQPVAFFNKKFLLNTLFDGDYGPSEHEIESTKNFIEEQNMPKILCLGPIMNPNKSLIFTIHHAIYKGVYCPISQS